MANQHSSGPSFAERYEAAIDRAELRLDQTGDCWLWPGATASGYGVINVCVGSKTTMFRVHRVMYERLVGPIPEGMQLDHLCRVRNCANPAHLEPVTHVENVRRGAAVITSCPQGHEYTAENTYAHKGRRHCRACWRIR